MGTSPGDALSQLFGAAVPDGAPVEEPAGKPSDTAGLIAKANRLWREAGDALKAGDWAGYGRAIDELGKVLSELTRMSGGALPKGSSLNPVTP